MTGAAFSLGQGIIHEYYTVALAPAIGALVGIGGWLLWQRRDAQWARVVFGATVAVTGWWGYTLLHRSPTWMPGLRVFVLAAGLFLGIGIAAAPALRGTRGGRGRHRRAGGRAHCAGRVHAVDRAHPAHRRDPHCRARGRTRGGFGGPGRGFANGPRFGTGGVLPNPGNGRTFPNGGVLPNPGNGGGFPGGGFPGGGRGGIGGLLNGSDPGAAVTKLLKQSTGYRWTAAAVGANNAAGYQLASGQAIMAIGGFNGTDPTPTLAQFQDYVRKHEVHYFISSGGGFGGGGVAGGPGGGSGASSEIAQWVESTFTARTVDGVTIYDLSSAS